MKRIIITLVLVITIGVLVMAHIYRNGVAGWRVRRGNYRHN